MKVYHRYKANPVTESLLPQKRGPKFKIHRTAPEIENDIVELRKLGNNRYAIKEVLKRKKKIENIKILHRQKLQYTVYVKSII